MLIQELLDVLPFVGELNEYYQKECAKALRNQVIFVEETQTMTIEQQTILMKLRGEERRKKRQERRAAIRRRYMGGGE